MKEISDVFEFNSSNYGRKLYLIENCIYGVDIQPIAIQISKLRFFISLIVDQKTGGTKENNYNVLPLPNLETKFVAANTLIGVIKKDKSTFDFGNTQIVEKEKELLEIRHRHFRAKTAKEKNKLRKRDDELCRELAVLLEHENLFSHEDAVQLAGWNPYNQTKASEIFDAYWMFGISQGFDVVIGNPPYVKTEHLSDETKRQLQEAFGYTHDLYIHFIFVGYRLIKQKGFLNFITNDGFLGFKTTGKIRELFFENNLLYVVKCPAETFGADIYTAIFLLQKEQSMTRQYETYQFITTGERNFALLPKGAISYELSDILVHKRLVIYNEFSKIMLGMTDMARFNDICSVLDTGIHTGNCRNKILFKEKVKNGLHKMLQGRQITRYGFDWDSPQAQYKWCDIDYKVQDVFGVGRGGKPSKAKEYWHFCGDESNHRVDEKLLLRQTDDDLIACYVNKAVDGLYYTDNTLHTILPKNDNDIKYILALINSRLLNAMYHFVSQEEGKAMAQVKTQVVESLPVPSITLQQQSPFGILVDKILAAKAASPRVDTATLEREIDKLVYKLYNLTYDEVKVIEPDFPLDRLE